MLVSIGVLLTSLSTSIEATSGRVVHRSVLPFIALGTSNTSNAAYKFSYLNNIKLRLN